MARKSVGSSSANATETNIIHINGIRMHSIGSGNLDLLLQTYNAAQEFQCLPIVLDAIGGTERFRLANIKGQRIRLEVSVDEFDEWFELNDLILFTKVMASSLPG